tara:strand:- start:7608 stop:8150 length:543 start_codon:yes stop_codon:yes gene_type:complete
MGWSRSNPKPVQVSNVLLILDNEFAYFLRLHDICEDLLKKAKKGKRSAAVREFGTLERFETREQMFASVKGRLIPALRAIIPIFDSGKQAIINRRATELEVFEGKLVFDTVKHLEPELLVDKNRKIINWDKVVEIITDEVMVDLKALVAADKGLRRIINKGPKPKKQPAFRPGRPRLAHA